jgi:hypothetical protein
MLVRSIDRAKDADERAPRQLDLTLGDKRTLQGEVDAGRSRCWCTHARTAVCRISDQAVKNRSWPPRCFECNGVSDERADAHGRQADGPRRDPGPEAARRVPASRRRRTGITERYIAKLARGRSTSSARPSSRSGTSRSRTTPGCCCASRRRGPASTSMAGAWRSSATVRTRVFTSTSDPGKGSASRRASWTSRHDDQRQPHAARAADPRDAGRDPGRPRRTSRRRREPRYSAPDTGPVPLTVAARAKRAAQAERERTQWWWCPRCRTRVQGSGTICPTCHPEAA